MFKNYRGRTVGAAKTIAEAPVSDGTTALEIENWKLNELGVLDSTFRLMPFIPSDLIAARRLVADHVIEAGRYPF